jgi:hypothetical protein
MSEEPVEYEVAGAPAAAAAEKPLPELAYTLYFGQFQQLSWLAVALAGGVLAMYQVGLFRLRPWNAIVATIIFALAALVAVLGPLELTRGLVEGKDIRRSVKRHVVAILILLGAGTGAALMGLIRTMLKGG